MTKKQGGEQKNTFEFYSRCSIVKRCRMLVEKEIEEMQPVRTSIHKHFLVRKNDMVVYGLGLILHYKIFSDATFFAVLLC